MARLLLLVTKINSEMPEAMASSAAYWISGLSTMGSISLGLALVTGKKRVPIPATGNTALRNFWVMRCTCLRESHSRALPRLAPCVHRVRWSAARAPIPAAGAAARPDRKCRWPAPWHPPVDSAAPIRPARSERAEFFVGGLAELLLLVKQLFVKLLTGAQAGEDDVDVLAQRFAGQADQLLGEVADLHRLPHVEHEYLAAFAHGGGLHDLLGRLRLRHVIACVVRRGVGDRSSCGDLLLKQRLHAAF